MSEDKTDNFPFQIIPEEASIEDDYANVAHQRLADTILKSFQDNNKGFTLGLEGRYGSGKSTVIRLVKKEIIKRKLKESFSFFYFDAWAHEGDPLRRVFLEEFIDQCLIKENTKVDKLKDIKKENKKAEKLKDKIAGKRFKREIDIKRGSTPFGFFIAIATFLVPLGITLISIIDKSNISFENTGKFNYWAISGVLLICAPLLVIIGNLLRLSFLSIKNRKTKKQSSNQWAILQGNDNETITENVKRSDERTSIEFEKYFQQIINDLNLNRNKKLIIVLDNIDRTLPQDTKKLISTLQNFLTDSSGLTEKEKKFDFVFTIIPYDLEGLNSKLSGEPNEFENIKAFLDKNIRLKLKVPDLILNDWRENSKIFIEKHLTGWDDSVVNDVIEILHDLYPYATFSPTPRELKIYVNQVGILRNHFNPKVISTRVLCYYIIKKFLPRKFDNDKILDEFSDKDIIDNIIKTDIPTHTENLIVNEEGIVDQLISLVYDLKESKDAFLLVLEKEVIEILLLQDNKSNLLNLEELHDENFWTILKQIFNKTQKQDDIFKYIHSIASIYEKDEKINFIKNNCDSIVSNVSYEVLRHYSDKSKLLEETLIFIIKYSSKNNFNKFLNDCVDALIVTLINEKVTEDYIISNYSILKNIFTNTEIKDKIDEFTPRTLEDEFNWELYSRVVYLNDFDHPFLLLKEESVEMIIEQNKNSDFKNENFPYFLIFSLSHNLIDSSTTSEKFYEILTFFNNWTDSIILKDDDKDKKVNILPIQYIDLYYHLAINYIEEEECNHMLDMISSADYFRSKLPVFSDFSDNLYFKYLTAYYYMIAHQYSEKHNDIEGNKLSTDDFSKFLKYFKNDVEKNKMYKQFLGLCMNPKAYGCFFIINSWIKEGRTDILYPEIEFGFLFTTSELFNKQNANRSEILKFQKWFKENTRFTNLSDSDKIQALYESSENLNFSDSQEDEFKKLVKQVYRIRDDVL